MPVVVQDLIFRAEASSGSLPEFFHYEVLYAAVAAFGNQKIQFQLKVGKLIVGDDVTAFVRVSLYRRQHAEDTVFHLPSCKRKATGIGPTPTRCRFAIPK